MRKYNLEEENNTSSFSKKVHNYLFRTPESSYTPELNIFQFLKAMQCIDWILCNTLSGAYSSTL